jgi:hypothetical protein
MGSRRVHVSPATRSTQRFCPDCGAKTTKADKFCRACGFDLREKADETAELDTADPAKSAKPSGARTQQLPPPPPPRLPPPTPGSAVTAQLPEKRTELPWSAWVAAGACGVLAIATGLPWFGGGFSLDGFDIPLAALFSDSATGGIPIGGLFVVAAAAGLGVALAKPFAGPLGITFLIVGAVSTVFILWYLIRVLSSSGGAPILEVVSFGVWLAVLSSLAVLIGGIKLQMDNRSTNR